MTTNASTQKQPIAKEDGLQAGQSDSLSSRVKDSSQLRDAPSEGTNLHCQSMKVPTPFGGLETPCLPLWANLPLLGILVLPLPFLYWLSLSRKSKQSSDAAPQPKWLLIILSVAALFLAGWAGNQAMNLLANNVKSASQSPIRNSTGPAIEENIPNPNSSPTPPSALFARPSETEARIVLSWLDAKLDEDGYRIQRRSLQGAGDDDYEEIAVLPASQTNFSDRSIIPGLGYTYRINSYNSVGSSFSPAARTRGNILLGSSQASERVNPEKVKALLNDIDEFERNRFPARIPSQEYRILFLVIELAMTLALTLLAMVATLTLDHQEMPSVFFGLKTKPRTYLILLLGVGAVTTQVVSSAYAGFMISASLKADSTAEARTELSILRSKAIDISTNKDYAMIKESFNSFSRSSRNAGF